MSSYSYGEAQYWDDRYSREGQGVVFDWYQAYNALKPVVAHYCKKSSKILMSGCGNAGERKRRPWDSHPILLVRETGRLPLFDSNALSSCCWFII